MSFEPIAIVGRSCVLPGAVSPEQLWDAVLQGRNLISSVPDDRWRVSKQRILSADSKNSIDKCWSDNGGYVSGFSDIFDPSGFRSLSAEAVQSLDPLFQWTLHTTRTALHQIRQPNRSRCGLVLGNLSFPSAGLSKYAEWVWFGERYNLPIQPPENRFMSGYPALLAAKSLGLKGPVFALDSACASSLYAIKWACDALHDRRADVMLAGAVNKADDLFIHVGFCALQAMSKTGQSRPFHRDADGLIPAEGAGIVVLKRLSDAVRDNEKIYGVIRGIGLSNDGRGRGLLAPTVRGQVSAISQAYRQAKLDPNKVGLLECHATGTPVGDITELRSMTEVFSASIPIGSLKSNMGHLITAAGVAGLLKVLSAMEHKLRPPTLHVEEPLTEFTEMPFRLLREAEPWKGPLRAGISAFGFGGNNAHLIVEKHYETTFIPRIPKTLDSIAIVGFEVAIGDLSDREMVAAKRHKIDDIDPKIANATLDMNGLKFPPNDLRAALGQQNVVLGLAQKVMRDVSCSENVGVWIAMGADSNVARYGVRWRLPEWESDQRVTHEIQQQVVPALHVAGVLGTMPNIPANRINSQFDLRGASASISAEEGSGIMALQLAVRALQNHEMDGALVGGVDLTTDVVHQKAIQSLFPDRKPVDGGGVLFLKRLSDALSAEDTIYGVIGDQEGESPQEFPTPFSGTHAASGIVQACCALIQLNQPDGPSQIQIRNDAMGGFAYQQTISQPPSVTPLTVSKQPRTPLFLPVHWRQINSRQRMTPAPSLPSVLTPVLQSPTASANASVNVLGLWNQVTAQHQSFLSQQQQMHQVFLQFREQLSQHFLAFAPSMQTNVVESPFPAPPPKSVPEEVAQPSVGLPGLKLDRAQLEIHASGNISEIYGPLFRPQDKYEIQTRMPEPPLLLADRVVGLEAVAGSMKTGTIWTETDVTRDAWYLHVDRMPAGIMIESGQADLMLISYLGIDLVTKGARAYRLLGCDLCYHDDLPQAGDTLRYDIHVDGHANQGPIRLFFFHYDCKINGQLRLTVRNGQAGYFTKEELADSAGIIWYPEQQEINPNPIFDPPDVSIPKNQFSPADMKAFAAGRMWQCFGESHMLCRTHTRTPTVADEKMLFIAGPTTLLPNGGPWKRGYMRVEVIIHPDDWFFKGHFKNDECMPGTLMFEGCLQAMAFYLVAMGYSNERDGWRFQPMTNRKYPLRCRGQVTKESRLLVYEIFVEEMSNGPKPYLVADLLCTVDGLKAFHARGMGLQMVPDYPLTTMRHLLKPETNTVATDKNGFPFDYNAMIASALGQPSTAFGSIYVPFDGPRQVARLPGPPYHFMSRVTKVEGELGSCALQTTIELEYDIPPEAWYFKDNGHPVMPFAVLLEAALQPCGWLASAVGSALVEDDDLYFRNLDGTGTLHCELFPLSGTLKTAVTIKTISRSGGMIIEGFDVLCTVGKQKVYSLTTVFGFFPKNALENQVGLNIDSTQSAHFSAANNFNTDLTARPPRYFAGTACLPNPSLCMLDRITAFVPDGGSQGLGFLRGEKDVDPNEWFFKAHFFQDPVQPGSLGIEAMLQLLQFYMLHSNMDAGFQRPRFLSHGIEQPMTWKYRGQVVPQNKCITTTMEITARQQSKNKATVMAKASLWIDGRRIYEARELSMEIVEDNSIK